MASGGCVNYRPERTDRWTHPQGLLSDARIPRPAHRHRRAAPRTACAVILYAITGRSPSSQARKLVLPRRRDLGPADRRGDPEEGQRRPARLSGRPLRRRPASPSRTASRPRTSATASRPGADPVAVLSRALSAWDFEPDAPIFTPRISGCLAGGRAALSVVRRGAAGESLRQLLRGRSSGRAKARLVSTYEGPNADPLPVVPRASRARSVFDGATRGRDRRSGLRGRSARPPGGKDFRVAVACVFASLAGTDRGRGPHHQPPSKGPDP
ncbi:MAG: IMP cyclohydrolase [Candidatus Moduliflexus flocculans]|nr:IMP cyclohydrolase [Candidatus Moduliflexus flocculans]